MANENRFVLTRTGDATNALTVSYAVKGTAVAGEDFMPLSGAKKFKAGKVSVQITVQPLPNGQGTVKLKIVGADSYTVTPPAQAKIKLGL